MRKLLRTATHFKRLLLVVPFTAAAILQAQQTNRSRPFAPGSCGPADPAYIRNAEDTGGIPFFFQRSEVAQATKFMLAETSQNHVTVLWAKGELQNGDSEFAVPVDSTLEFVLFTISVGDHNTRMEVFGPDSAPITGDPQAETTDFTCGRYIILKKPAPGRYRVRIKGSGRFWLSVGGKSEIFLYRVEFVEPGGRPGHEGMFAIHGQPLVSKPANLEASLSGDVRNVAFTLVTAENRAIKTLDLEPVRAERDEHEFAGNFALPEQPFRVLASGVDHNGHRFQRVHEGLFRPTTISLALVSAPDLEPGHTVTITFKAANLGHSDAFRFVAVCANGWPVRIDRNDIYLASGESTNLVVSLTVPAQTGAYSAGDLVLTATSENDPSITNGVVHHLSVEPGRK